MSLGPGNSTGTGSRDVKDAGVRLRDELSAAKGASEPSRVAAWLPDGAMTPTRCPKSANCS
jgi:hypothetical protein